MAHAIVIIPARYASSRFPGKPLATLEDKPLIRWVWEAARAARRIERVVVATDDARIASVVRAFGGESAMTPNDLPTGTDRIALVARDSDCEIIVNVQGDEPLVTGASIDRLVEALEADPTLPAATLREPLESVEDLFDPNVVKVVLSRSGDALYFSRSPIPYFRGKPPLAEDFRAALEHRGEPMAGYSRHVGVYAFRRDTLLEFASAPRTPLETAEGLEQVRLLEMGRRIGVVDADFRSVGVDTPRDLERAAEALAAGRGNGIE